MFPITEQEFEESYQKCGFSPTIGAWFDGEFKVVDSTFYLQNVKKCCPLGAKLYCCFDSEKELLDFYNVTPYTIFAEKLKLNHDQTLGFTNGFDGRLPRPKYSGEDYVEAFEFGQRMRKKFLPTMECNNQAEKVNGST